MEPAEQSPHRLHRHLLRQPEARPDQNQTSPDPRRDEGHSGALTAPAPASQQLPLNVAMTSTSSVSPRPRASASGDGPSAPPDHQMPALVPNEPPLTAIHPPQALSVSSIPPVVIPLHSSHTEMGSGASDDLSQEDAYSAPGTDSYVLRRDRHLTSILQEFHQFYRDGKFTNLSLQCADGVSIKCHKFIVAFVSKTVAMAVATAAGSCIQDADEDTTLLLPDFHSARMRQFLDSLYSLVSATSEEYFNEIALTLDTEIVTALDIVKAPSAEHLLRWFQPPQVGLTVKLEAPSDEDDQTPFEDMMDPSVVLPSNTKRTRSSKKRKRGLDERELRKVIPFVDSDDEWTPDHPDNFENYESRVASNMKQEMYEDDGFVVGDSFGYAEKKPRISRRSNSAHASSSNNENRFGLALYKASDGPERGEILDQVRTTTESCAALMTSAAGVLHDVRWHRSGACFQKKTYASIKKVLEPYPFRAVVAVAPYLSESGNIIRARPIGWSNPSKQEFIDSFDRMITDFKVVYGFSEQDLHCTSSILKFVDGLDNNTVRRKRKYVRNRDLNKLHKEPRDKLKALLKDDRISQYCDKAPPKDPNPGFLPNLDGESGSFNLHLTKERFEAEACLILLWDHRGRATAKMLTLPNQPHTDPEYEITVDFLYCVLVGVWCSTMTTLPRAPEIEERIYGVESISNLPDVVDKIMNSERPERQCPDCGDVFPYFTLNQKTNYHNHVTRHSYDKFQCDCEGIVFKDRHEKREHALLKHSDGKYEQCIQCPFIGLKSGINAHYNECHKHLVCEECGKTFSETAKYNQHVNCAHRPSVCDICGETFVGYARYRHHIDRFHNNGPYQCDQCTSVFKDKHLLRNHKNRMHQPDDQKKFQCEQCGKGFMTRQKVDQHRMNVHIKARPYVCRFGCGAAYNDRSNQINHEKKKHANQQVVPEV